MLLDHKSFPDKIINFSHFRVSEKLFFSVHRKNYEVNPGLYYQQLNLAQRKQHIFTFEISQYS